MKYYFDSICINPIAGAYAVGFAVNKEKYFETKLALYMRVLLLEDKDNSVMLLNIDNLGISYDVYLEFADVLKKKYPKTYLITTATHTHYAPSLANELPMNICDEIYKKQVLDSFDKLINQIKLKEIDGYVDYHYLPFDKVGSPRISKKSHDNVYAGVLSIFDNEQRIGNILFYNCHPTEDDKDPGYFSSAFVGETLRIMDEKYPDEFFMYMQGCSGDVSSRFTRKERSFNQTLEFGKIMSDCFDKIIKQNKKNERIDMSYDYHYYKFKAEFKKLPYIPKAFLLTLKEAERNELLIGLEELKKYQKQEMPKNNDVLLSRLSLGKYKLFFSPFELFTNYNDYIDKDRQLLIGYSNGILAYLLPINNKEISYEYFLETTTNKDKKIILNDIHNL